MNILVVDSHDNTRQSVIKILKQQNWEITAFSDTLTAAEYLRFHEPDVALIDWTPGIVPTGFHLAQHIRDMFPSCVIVIMSAFAREKELEQMIRLGIDGFIRLPDNVSDITDHIAEAVMLRHKRFSKFGLPGPSDTVTKLN